MDNVLNEIKSEHDEIRELLAKIKGYERINWDTVEELYVTLKGHHDAEEAVVFPKVRDVDTEAQELIQHLEEEHDESESKILQLIEAHEFDHEEFEEIIDTITEHMEEEETDLFEKSKKAMSTSELEDALDPFEDAEDKGKEAAEKVIKGVGK